MNEINEQLEQDEAQAFERAMNVLNSSENEEKNEANASTAPEGEKEVEDPKNEQIEEEKQEQEQNEEHDSFAPKFAALSKKDKEIRLKQQELERRTEEFQQKQQQLEDQLLKLKNNPIKVLTEDLGYSFEDLVDFATKEDLGEKDLKVKSMEEKIKELEQSFEEKLKEKELETAKREQEQQIQQFQNHLNKHIVNNKENYELINLYGAEDQVFDVISQFANDYGKLPDIDEACKHVEEQLEERWKAEQEKFASSKRLRSLFGTGEKEVKRSGNVPGQQGERSKKVAPSLSSVDSTTMPNREKLDDSEEARMERAIRIAEGHPF